MADQNTAGLKMGECLYKTRLDKSGVLKLSDKPRVMPYKVEPQGEGLSWDAKGKGYYTLSESAEDVPQVLYYYK